MPSTFADYARAAGAWLKSNPLHTVAPLALFFAILVITSIAAIPHHHAGAASAAPARTPPSLRAGPRRA